MNRLALWAKKTSPSTAGRAIEVPVLEGRQPLVNVESFVLPPHLSEVASHRNHCGPIGFVRTVRRSRSSKSGGHRPWPVTEVARGKATAGQAIETTTLDTNPAGEFGQREVGFDSVVPTIHTLNHSQAWKLSQITLDRPVDKPPVILRTHWLERIG